MKPTDYLQPTPWVVTLEHHVVETEEYVECVEIDLIHLFDQLGITKSRSDTRRLIAQGAVEYDFLEAGDCFLGFPATSRWLLVPRIGKIDFKVGKATRGKKHRFRVVLDENTALRVHPKASLDG